MSDRRFAMLAAAAVAVAALCLIAGSALERQWLSALGVLALLVAFAAREAWRWRDSGRVWRLAAASMLIALLGGALFTALD